MEVPLNIIHDYIGFPILVGIGLDSLRRYRKSQNITAKYIGWTSLLTAVTTLSFGLPVLFTHDPFLLSVGTFIGDCAFAVAMLMLWLIVIRGAFITRPRLFIATKVAAGLLTAGLIVEAVLRNLVSPYSTFVTKSADGIALLYRDSTLYKILSGIDSLAMLLVSIYFWKLASAAPTTAQRLRIRSFAVAFVFFASAFVLTPAFPVDNQAAISFTLLSIGFIIVGVFSVIGTVLNRRQAPTQVVQEQPTDTLTK